MAWEWPTPGGKQLYTEVVSADGGRGNTGSQLILMCLVWGWGGACREDLSVDPVPSVCQQGTGRTCPALLPEPSGSAPELPTLSVACT